MIALLARRKVWKPKPNSKYQSYSDDTRRGKRMTAVQDNSIGLYDQTYAIWKWRYRDHPFAQIPFVDPLRKDPATSPNDPPVAIKDVIQSVPAIFLSGLDVELVDSPSSQVVTRTNRKNGKLYNKSGRKRRFPLPEKESRAIPNPNLFTLHIRIERSRKAMAWCS